MITYTPEDISTPYDSYLFSFYGVSWIVYQMPTGALTQLSVNHLHSVHPDRPTASQSFHQDHRQRAHFFTHLNPVTALKPGGCAASRSGLSASQVYVASQSWSVQCRAETERVWCMGLVRRLWVRSDASGVVHDC